MKLLFIASTRIPTERAMGTAIMKQCEAFARHGVVVELWVPRRINAESEDPFTYHGVERNFTVRYIPSLDLNFLGTYAIRFILQKASFVLGLFLRAPFSDADIWYSREPELIGLLPTSKKKCIELHHFFGLGTFGKFFLHSCDRIITITHALKDDVHTHFDIPISKIHVAPSGVSLSEFKVTESKEDMRVKLGVITPLPVALYIGALETWKGYITFLEAHAKLHGTVHAVVIGGNNEQVSDLRRRYPNVQFLGFLPLRDLPHNQKIADVLVIPNSAKEEISARHTSPLKVFAHMASGIPIVASRLPSVCEVLTPMNALLVEPDNADLLAEGIICALQDKKHSTQGATQALQDVQAYDWSVRTNGIMKYINEPT